MLNHVVITGNICSDPIFRQEEGKTDICTARIAVRRDSRDKRTGNFESDFFTVVAFGGAAGFMNSKFHKGKPITVDGHLKSSVLEKGGVTVNSVEIIADSIYYADSRPAEKAETTERNEDTMGSVMGSVRYDAGNFPF